MKTLPTAGLGPAHGYLYVHVAPRPVLKSIEWGLAEVLQMPISLNWKSQPISSGGYRSELAWNGVQGTASRLVSSLKGWHYLTFELFESPIHGSDGSLYMYTPDLGLYRGTVNPHGDLMINENQISRILQDNPKAFLAIEALESLLGKKWDEALDPFRHLSIGGENLDARLSV